MMLAGFSQGGAMSLFTGLQLQLEIEGDAGTPSLAVILVMSGYLPGKGSLILFVVLMHCKIIQQLRDSSPRS